MSRAYRPSATSSKLGERFGMGRWGALAAGTLVGLKSIAARHLPPKLAFPRRYGRNSSASV